MTQPDFSLERFEYLCYTHERESAARELIKLLHMLDSRFGALDIKANLYATNAPTQTNHLLARLTSALSCLFCDPQFQLSPQGFAQLISWQRWLSALFAASPLGNADHVLRALNTRKEDGPLELTHEGLVKFCMLFTPDSQIPIDLDALWQYDKRLTVALCFVLLSPRFLGTTTAHAKRETLLAWLPQRLAEIPDLQQLPVGILHDVYMHCSYADLPTKHDIKRPINAMIRSTLHAAGLSDLPPPTGGVKPRRPIMFVVLEYLSVNHSIYRTHSSTLRAARDKFQLVGFGLPQYVDEAGRAVFDEFIELGGELLDMIGTIRRHALERQIEVLYMPSVGMFPLTMFLANLRIAPLQLMALGHPATTHSPCIDYVVVEEDYVGDAKCFSEELLVLPADGLPYVPSGAAAHVEPLLREAPEKVRIAVCATTMKLNPHFLWACAQIVRRASKEVEFHFLVGFSQGVIGVHVEQVIHQYLGPYAKVYGHQPYPDYMEVVRQCDMFINPFPFGNTNGIVDTVSAGLVGVCRTGREVHEHIDQGLFARLGIPAWMVATTTEEYVNAAVRLVDDEKERLALRRTLIAKKSVKRLFEGRPEIFGERVLELVKRPKEVKKRSAGANVAKGNASTLAVAALKV
jgi:hypothetical protein